MNINNITSTSPVTFTQFYTLLVNADWFYYYSDDSSVFNRGQTNATKLNAIAKRHDFAAYMFSHFCDVRSSSIQGGDVVQQSLVQLKDNWDNMSVVALGAAS